MDHYLASELSSVDAARPGNPVGSVTPNAQHAAVKAVQHELMGSLRGKRGILNGKYLYRDYGEAKQELLRTAIRSLEEKNMVTVRGNLDSPLGVFESVLLER